MSYPPQYPPPPAGPYGYNFDYYQPHEDLLAPARRASIMMYVLGAFMLLCGVGCGVAGAVLPWDELIAQQPVLTQANPEITPDVLQLGMIVLGVISALAAIVLLILAYFVRSGGVVPVTIALVITCILALGVLVNLVSGLVQMSGAGGAQMAGAVCVNLVPLALIVLLLSWLIQAIRAAPRLQQARQQHQMQMWSAQQQQPPMPGAYGYHGQSAPAPQGYETPNVPPPPPSPPYGQSDYDRRE